MRTQNRKHKRDYYRNDRDRSDQKKSPGFLPPPGILESYELIVPGSVDKILEMARLEQEHRHNWEMKYLRQMAYSTRIGQLLGFALAIIIIYGCIISVVSQNYFVATLVAVSGFGFLIATALASFRSMKPIMRPRRMEDKI
jgi:uncharacterized membrane protein